MSDTPTRILVDDPEIGGSVSLLRQINPSTQASHVDWEQMVGGQPRVRSAAFQRASRQFALREGYPEQTLSLFLEKVVVDEHGTVELWLDAVDRSSWGVVRITAQLLRDEGAMAIERDDHRALLGHCVAWATGSSGKARSAEPILAARAEWVVVPERFV